MRSVEELLKNQKPTIDAAFTKISHASELRGYALALMAVSKTLGRTFTTKQSALFETLITEFETKSKEAEA